MPDEEGRARSDSEKLLLFGVELLVGEQTVVAELWVTPLLNGEVVRSRTEHRKAR